MGLKILICCEESQVICNALRTRGIEAYSCDLQECSGGHPEWHIKQDVIPLINGNCEFTTMDGQKHKIDGKWSCLICHPDCTFLCVAGNRYFNEERYGDKARERKANREKAADFFMKFINADCDHIAVENPVSVMSTRYRKPDQIINPFQFGHPVGKKTCLWLKGLPLLQPTNIVEPERIHSKGKSGGYSHNSWYVTDENGKILSWKDPRTAKARSRTYEGIGKAIAKQWGDYLLSLEENNNVTNKSE